MQEGVISKSLGGLVYKAFFHFFLEDFSQEKMNAGQNLCPTEVKGMFASNFSKADLAPLDLKAVLLEQEQSKSYV